MGWWIVKQPDGKFARFSTVVDDFTHYGMTEAEAVEVCRGENLGQADARAKVDRAIGDEALNGGGPRKTNGLWRWRRALSTIRVIHGPERRRQRIREILGDQTGGG